MTPPEASVGTRPAMSATAARSVPASILSSNKWLAPAARPGSIWAILSTSRIMRSTPAFRARATASATPPATATWLSLIMAASHNPMRWFVAPPMRVAYFSSTRRPGMVFLVSKRIQPVPDIASTYCRVIVAMPDRCCAVFSADRSAVNIARALPFNRIRSVPAGTCWPSSTNIAMSIAGSRDRKNAAAIDKPATVIASRLSMTPSNFISAGITLSDVTSLPVGPRSSASVARTKASRSKWGRVKTMVLLSGAD